MNRHIWMWGIIGAIAAVAVGLIGMSVAPQANLGCLASLLIPLIVGFMAARASLAADSTVSIAQHAIDGGLAAGIAAVVGGTLNLLTGCASIPSHLSANRPGDLFVLLLTGIAAVGIAYFLQGFLVGIVAVSVRSVSRSR